jgi:hypothetical protein
MCVIDGPQSYYLYKRYFPCNHFGNIGRHFYNYTHDKVLHHRTTTYQSCIYATLSDDSFQHSLLIFHRIWTTWKLNWEKPWASPPPPPCHWRRHKPAIAFSFPCIWWEKQKIERLYMTSHPPCWCSNSK